MNIFDSCEFERTAGKILELWFGSIVARVARDMYRITNATYPNIKEWTKLPCKEVQKALLSLLQLNIIKVESRKPLSFKLIKKNIFYRQNMERYVRHVRETLGLGAEVMIDKVMDEGRATASQLMVALCCKTAASGAPAATGTEDRHVVACNELRKLLERGYLQRCVTQKTPTEPQGAGERAAAEDDVQPTKKEEIDGFFKSHVDLGLIKAEVDRQELSNISSAGSWGDSSFPDKDWLWTINDKAFPDRDWLWTINYEAFHLEWRNERLCSYVCKSIGSSATDVFKAFLATAYQTEEDKWKNGVRTTTAAVKIALPHYRHVDDYLMLFERESGGGVSRDGVGGGGGEFQLDVASVVSQLAREFVANVITDKFGSKAATIFRLVLRKQIMSGDFIASVSLLDKKEADQLCNTLLLHHYLTVHDLSKPSMPANAAKDMLFFKVNFLEVARMTASHCFTTICNVLTKREAILESNKSLLEKKARLDVIQDKLQVCMKIPDKREEAIAQADQLKEYIGPSEQAVLDKVQQDCDYMLRVVQGVCEDTYLLELYFRYYPYMSNLSTGRRSQCLSSRRA